MILQVPNPGHGCRTAIYPETQWRGLRCGKGLRIPHILAYTNPPGIHPAVGGDAYFAVPNGGQIKSALAWFPTVKNVGTEQSEGGTGVYDGFNYYSLQLNTNGFNAGYMCPNLNCKGAEQLSSTTKGTPPEATEGYKWSTGCLIMRRAEARRAQIPVRAAGTVFVKGSKKHPEESCTTFSDETDVQSYDINHGLLYFRLGGSSASQPGGSGSDYATLDVYGGPSPQLYQQDGNNIFPGLSNGWSTVAFNVFGTCCGSTAVFSGNPTIAVRLAVTTVNNTKTRPKCPLGLPNNGAFTVESNNLKLIATPNQWPEKDLAGDRIYGR